MKTSFELDGQPAARMWIPVLVSRPVLLDSVALDFYDNGDQASVNGKREIEAVLRDRVTNDGMARFREHVKTLRDENSELWQQAEAKANEVVSRTFAEFN